MTTEQLFSLANAIALVGWAALLLAPLRPGAAVAAARWVAAVLAGLYTVLFTLGLLGEGGGEGAGAFEYTAAGLAALFRQPEVLLVGWVHYLCFDLFVGSWIVQTAGERRVPHWLVIPCLALCFLAGPIGFLLFLLVLLLRRGQRA